MDVIFKSVEEQEFRDIVLQEHLDGNFRGDPHKMEVKFKRNKNSVDFVSVVGYDNDTVCCFCGMDIYESKEGLVGMIHCLGVPKNYRKKNLSNLALEEVEVLAKDVINKRSKLVAVYSTCNPISAKTHQKNGYVITHPGRLSKTGKLMQIRLKKTL